MIFNEKQGRFLWQRDVITAIILLTFGLYKKVVIGDGVGGLVNQNLEMGIDGMGPYDAAATMLGFSSQIYCDFSGYSDMALGFAILLGIYIPANFNYPFKAWGCYRRSSSAFAYP